MSTQLTTDSVEAIYIDFFKTMLTKQFGDWHPRVNCARIWYNVIWKYWNLNIGYACRWKHYHESCYKMNAFRPLHVLFSHFHRTHIQFTFIILWFWFTIHSLLRIAIPGKRIIIFIYLYCKMVLDFKVFKTWFIVRMLRHFTFARTQNANSFKPTSYKSKCESTNPRSPSTLPIAIPLTSPSKLMPVNVVTSSVIYLSLSSQV